VGADHDALPGETTACAGDDTHDVLQGCQALSFPARCLPDLKVALFALRRRDQSPIPKLTGDVLGSLFEPRRAEAAPREIIAGQESDYFHHPVSREH